MKAFRGRGHRPMVGVFGGAFDPPHLGHALLPGYLRARGLVDALVVAPCADHPLGKTMSGFEARLAWTRAAMEPYGGWVEVTDLEARLSQAHGPPSYTLRLLDAVAAARPEARVRLVLGSDIVASGETGKWHRWDQIAATYDPVVVPRTGHGDGLGALPEVSSTRVREDIAAGHWPEVAAQVPAAVVDLLRQPCRGTIAVIGEGHVATHAVPWLRRRGYLVVQAPGRDPRAALQSDTRVTGVWLLVEDRAIASVAQVCVGSIPPGTPVLHAAGPFLAADVLRPLQAAGHPVGTLHPICSLRRERPWPPRLNDAAFGIEGDPQARALAIDLVGVQSWLDLQALDEAGRRAYHGACALLANHLAVLLDAAGSVLRGQGHDDANIDAALAVLLRSAVDNLLALGIPAGITGPVARGDTATVRAHLEALPAEVAELYAVLSARLTAMI